MEREFVSSQDQIYKSLVGSIRESFKGNLFGDVMIVGGGVSGVQASLDLAASGFKVYLVDKAPAIGGHMAQLDKTFPTNDCSI
jgi:heterodisulfide reductase subunit A-like polyferredoxin